VPIFPELAPYLADAFDLAPPGQEYVITRYRDTGVNLRTQLGRIIRRAGLTPWPKLFHNLRATRETELAERYPIHVVCAWIGNSAVVAQKHYLQVTEDHFAEATAGASEVATEVKEKAAQNPAQSAAVTMGLEQTGIPATSPEPLGFQGLSTQVIGRQKFGLPLVGIEPTTY
jgi:hypothetical protein